MNLYKESATTIKKEKPDDFTEKAEKETLKQRKKSRNVKIKKEEVQPSDIYLQSTTKDNPIVIGKNVVAADPGSPSFVNSMTHFNNTVLDSSVHNKNLNIAGTEMHLSKKDNEIGVKETII